MINRSLDEEEQYNTQLHLTLLITSGLDAKGSKKIAKNFEHRKTELDSLREDITKHGYDQKRVEKEEETTWSNPTKLRTKEDLVRELYRQMRGEKDAHDQFIDAWVERQKKASEAARKRVEDRQKEFRQSFEEMDLTSVEDSRPVTVEEIQQLNEKKSVTNANKYMTSYAESDHEERFLKKVSARVIKKVT